MRLGRETESEVRRLSTAQLAGLVEHFVICKYDFQNFLRSFKAQYLFNFTKITSSKNYALQFTSE